MKHPAPQPKVTQWRRNLRRRALVWYRRHARDLSWRRTSDPYHVWVSEIMLQQTQVATVESYFPRFLDAFPTIAALAAADEAAVLRQWEGLGYYRRARQLRTAAQQIVCQHDGVFPREPEEVLALPGIGRYTAGAILSIAFDARRPILEANTVRLYARLLGYAGEVDSAVGRQQLWGAAESWLPRKDVGSFNQAMMEIGSLVCRPRNPVCDECPLVESCVAHAEGIQRTLPKLKPRRKREKVRTAAVVVRRRGRVLVAKSNGEASGRWAGLWDFPRFDVAISASQSRVATDVTAALAVWGVDVTLGEQLTTIKHAVTHHDITVDCYAAVCNEDAKTNGTHNGRPELRWVRPDELEELPMNVTARRLADVISKL